jgi:uncharacterized membrane protein YgdD (TMEM256/DUF423 family)
LRFYFMTQSTLLLAAGFASELAPPLDSAAVPEHAPFVALAFLGAGAALGIAAGAAVLCLALRRRRAAAVAGATFAVGGLLYAGLLLALSLTSHDRVLASRGRKYFCEIDCHLAYSVAGVERTPNGALAVRVRTWFDPSTIASFRGNAPLTPNPREAWLVDARGKRIAPSPAATKAYAESHGGFEPFSKTLTPGQSYETALVFEAPPSADSKRLRLLVCDPPGIENAMLGHENSPLHGKVYLAVD